MRKLKVHPIITMVFIFVYSILMTMLLRGVFNFSENETIIIGTLISIFYFLLIQ
jgi:hypothetical protein